ncbi:MAG: hypothetical protein Fur0046_34880 [Cyanobacteria bacterium J069]|nr:MAG: hypothetical protein D6742_02130 [Cyanobacteria bacterium J069]
MLLSDAFKGCQGGGSIADPLSSGGVGAIAQQKRAGIFLIIRDFAGVSNFAASDGAIAGGSGYALGK